MFEAIGRSTDEEVGKRQLLSIGTVAMIGATAFCVGWLTTVLIPPALPEPGPPVVILPPSEWPTEPSVEPEQAPPAPPIARAPRGGGQADPAVDPFDAEPPPLVNPTLNVRDHEPTGSGTGTGVGTGDGDGPTQAGQRCPAGMDCTTGGGGGGSRLVSHGVLTRVSGASPSYPVAARRAGYTQESCTADLSIDRKGRVYAVDVHDCPPVFHRAVERTLLGWRYQPRRTDAGQLVEARTRIVVRFRR